MLLTGANMGVNFAKWGGAFQERAAMAASRLEDQVVNGVIVKRRVTGPPTLVEWNPCWNIFANCCLIFKASAPGPLDEYAKKMKVLDARTPGRFSILYLVDVINR